jgi:hypothetical protein
MDGGFVLDAIFPNFFATAIYRNLAQFTSVDPESGFVRTI